MKRLIFLLAVAVVVWGPTARAQTEAEITYQEFYDGLAPYGNWLYVDDYGYCWQPGVEEGWRPYTNGSWIYTDAGWTWSSDEEWGWATDHYGRWMLTKDFGWLWVPGYEWAPAWVSWRKSDDYVGWAPLPPEATWQPASGFGPSVDVSFSIGPDYYNFCPVRHLGAPRLRPYIVPARENVSIINNTVNVTKITNVNNVMIFNEGPNFTQISRRTEQPIRWARLERRWDVNREVVRAGGVRNRVEGDVFRVVAPRVDRSTRDERPPKVAGTIRREEFDEKIGQERRRVRERTREMNRSAEADVPPPPEGRDQRFEPDRKDQGVTEGRDRRERGSRQLESETLRNQQRSEDQTRGRDRQMRQEQRTGPEDSSQTPHSTDRQRLEAGQPTPPSGEPSREERRRGRSDAQGKPEGRDTQRQQRREDQSEESLQGSPPGQPGQTPTRESARERSQRGDSAAQKPLQDRREQGGAREGADIQRKQGRAVDQSEQSLQGSPAGDSQPPDVPRERGQRERGAQKPQQDSREVQGNARPGDVQRQHERGRNQSDESASGSPPGQRPPAEGPPPQPSREKSQRNQSDGEQRSKSREERQRDSQGRNVQQKQAEAARENAQPSRKGGENIRQEQRSGPPAERRDSNGQQQRQRGDQKAQAEKSGPPQGQQQKSQGDGQKKGKGKKSDSKGEGDGNTQSGEGQGQDGRGE
jgi:hypothetical protein